MNLQFVSEDRKKRQILINNQLDEMKWKKMTFLAGKLSHLKTLDTWDQWLHSKNIDIAFGLQKEPPLGKPIFYTFLFKYLHLPPFHPSVTPPPNSRLSCGSTGHVPTGQTSFFSTSPLIWSMSRKEGFGYHMMGAIWALYSGDWKWRKIDRIEERTFSCRSTQGWTSILQFISFIFSTICFLVTPHNIK